MTKVKALVTDVTALIKVQHESSNLLILSTLNSNEVSIIWKD